MYRLCGVAGLSPVNNAVSVPIQVAEIAEESCLQQRFEMGDLQLSSNHTVFHGRAAYEDRDAAEQQTEPGEHTTRNLFRLWLTADGWNRSDLFDWEAHLRAERHGQGTTTLLVRLTLYLHHSLWQDGCERETTQNESIDSVHSCVLSPHPQNIRCSSFSLVLAIENHSKPTSALLACPRS